jgi:hypothetical protein
VHCLSGDATYSASDIFMLGPDGSLSFRRFMLESTV